MTYEDLFDLIYSTRISESLKDTILSQYSCPIEEAVEKVNPYIEFLDTLVNSSISEDLLYSIIDETFSTLDEEVINEVSDQWIKGKVDNAVKKAHAGTKDAVGLNAFRNYDKTMDRAETVMNKAANRPTYSNPQPKQASPKDPVGLSSFKDKSTSTSNTEKKEGALGKLKSAVGKVFNKTRAEKDLRPKDIQPHLAKLDVQDKPETVGKAPKAEKVKPASPKVEKTQKVEKVKPATIAKKDKNVKNASGEVKTTTASKPEKPPVPAETPVADTSKRGSKSKVNEEPAPVPTDAPVAKKAKASKVKASKVKASKPKVTKVKVEKKVEAPKAGEVKTEEPIPTSTEAPKAEEVKVEKKQRKPRAKKTKETLAETPKIEAKKEEAPKAEVKTVEEKKPKVYIKPGQLSTPNNGRTTGSYKNLNKIDQEIKKGEEEAAKKDSNSKLSDKDKYAAKLRRQMKQEQENQKKALENLRKQRASVVAKPGYSNKTVADLDKRIENLEKKLATVANESLAEALYLIATTNISESAYVQIAELLAASDKNVEKVKKAREQAVYDAVDKMENDILTHKMNKETAKNAEDAENKRERFEELYRKRFNNN